LCIIPIPEFTPKFITYVLSYGFALKKSSLINLYMFDKTGVIVIGIKVQKHYWAEIEKVYFTTISGG